MAGMTTFLAERLKLKSTKARIGYFQYTQSKGLLETLDGRIRRLRCVLWRQAKNRATAL